MEYSPRVEHKLADLSLKDASLVMIHSIVTVNMLKACVSFPLSAFNQAPSHPFSKYDERCQIGPNKFPSTICHGFGIENLNF